MKTHTINKRNVMAKALVAGVAGLAMLSATGCQEVNAEKVSVKGQTDEVVAEAKDFNKASKEDFENSVRYR